MAEFGYYFDSPKFTTEEYQRRLSLARKAMQEKGIEVLILVSPKNLFYMTGYNTIGTGNYQALVIPESGEVAMLMREMEKGVADATSWVEDKSTWADHEEPTGALMRLLKDHNWLGKVIGFEKNAQTFSPANYEKLLAGLGKTPLDGSDILNGIRVIKCPQEIEYIRRAAKISGLGMAAAMNTIGEGVNENDVVAEIYSAMVRAGSELMSSGPIVTGGYKSGVAHTDWQRYTLKRGDAILFEIGGCWNRYSGPLMRSAAILEANDEILRMADTVKRALEAAIAAIRPGVTSGYVDEACRKVIEDAGFEEMFRKRTGYSVGVGFTPSWMEAEIFDLKKDDPRVLKAGMVFHMPPALRRFKKYGVGNSETVLVTENGCEVLTSFPREFFISNK
jgi:Xaa-Pro dipeptidase